MATESERRRLVERRAVPDRRLEVARADGLVDSERRANAERRSGLERRLSVLSAEEQIRQALRLLTQVIETGTMIEGERRSLEGAMLRLRFALDRLEA